jgi:hypothetical protein
METNTLITLTRYDTVDDDDEQQQNVSKQIDPESLQGPMNRDIAISKFNLPTNAVIKLVHDGKLIPWSMLYKVPTVEIQVFRPRQTSK